VGVNGCFEKDINLSISKKLKTYLEARGVKCILTREDDRLLYDRNADHEGQKKRLDMLERLRIATSYENAVFISIHQNSFSSEKYSGLQIYYSENNESSLMLADTVSTAVKRTLQTDNRRVSKPSGGNIYLLERLACPAVLIECGFISNHADCNLLCSEEYQNKLSEIMSEAIFSFLSNPYM
jgi:N-acetylmuramoyl-L-alanine amidase